MKRTLAAFALLAAVGCRRAPSPETAAKAFGAAIVDVSGESQVTGTGASLDQPVVVQVNDAQGNGVAGALVQFSAASGVVFSPPWGLTGTDGQFSTTVRLGTMSGRYSVVATSRDKTGKALQVTFPEIALDYQQMVGRELNEKYCSRCHNSESTAERVSNHDNLSVRAPFFFRWCYAEPIQPCESDRHHQPRRRGAGQVSGDAALQPHALGERHRRISGLYPRGRRSAISSTRGFLKECSMRIRSLSRLAILLTAFAAQSWNAPGQVLSPAEIQDPALRGLQQSHLDELHAITAALKGHKFPYHFYFSRRLDLTEREQERSDQRSIQFDRFRDQTVIKITGNYFAAYSAERMTGEERARQTYRDVMLPILQAAAPALARADVPDAFALEISHHVIRKVLGVETESPENVVLILPKASAQHLMEARDEAGRDAAVLDGTAYLNGAPVLFWPRELKESPAARVSAASSAPAAPARPAAPAPASPAASPSSSNAPANLDAEYRDTARRHAQGTRFAGALRALCPRVFHCISRRPISSDPHHHDSCAVRFRLAI